MKNDRETNEFHLLHAPIVEAVIAIKFAERLPENALSGLEECARRIQEIYPIKDVIRSQQFQVMLGVSTQSNVETPKPEGFFCKMSNDHRVVHLKLDSFGFSELAPYSSWNSFFPEARRLWEEHQRTIGTRPVDSWSIRYINRISWPEGAQREEYMRVYPHIPDGIPQDMVGCFMRLQIPVQRPTRGLFTQQLFTAPPLKSGMVSVVLDHEFSYSALGLTESALWTQIEQSREVKNDFFRASLTEKALETFK
ncbi:MAG: TIGR04255 family protein [Terracidiphilus sp.]|jgi:uncharacterized protein (TIGR04255 family)